MSKKKKKEKLNFIEWLSLVPVRSYVVFSILISIIFIQSLKFGFTYCDDLGLVGAKELKLSNINLIFQKGVFYFTGDIDKDPYYRPMQNLVYAAGKIIAGGKDAWIQHLIGILLHFIAACLLFNFLIAIGYRKTISLTATCFFIVHPLLAQAVAWIPGIGELLITVFLLSSFIFLIKFLEKDKTDFLQLLFCILFFFAALLSKESAVGFIPIVFLYALFINKNKERIFFKLMLFTAGVLPVLITWYFLRENAVGKNSEISFSNITFSLVNNGSFLVYYIGKIFLPIHLSPLQPKPDSGIVPGTICILILLILLFVIKSKRNRVLLAFGAAWYLTFLAPTLFVTNPAFEFYSYYHRLYFPFIGLLIVVLEIFAFSSKNYNVKILSGTTAIIFIAFLFLSFNFSRVFRDKYSFYDAAVENAPHADKAFETLGKFYLEEKKCDLALESFKKAALLQPQSHGYYGLVANTYNSCMGDIPNAMQWYRKAMEVDSVSKMAANTAISLGNIYYMSLKDNAQARFWYEKAVKMDSGQVYPMGILGNILFSINQDSAKYWYERALRKDSASSVSLNGLGLISFSEKDFNKAIYYFGQAMKHESSDIQLLKNLMLSYQAIDDFNNTKKFAEEYESRGGVVPDDVKGYIEEKKKSL